MMLLPQAGLEDKLRMQQSHQLLLWVQMGGKVLTLHLNFT